MARSRFIDNAIVGLLYCSGAYRLFETFYGGDGAILTFHRVRPAAQEHSFTPNRALEITPEFFETVVRLIMQRDIDIVTLDEAVRRLNHCGVRGAEAKARRFACLTFDDGYRDNLDYALPVCRRLGVPMTVYLTTGFVDRSVTPWWMALEKVIREVSRLEYNWRGHRVIVPTGTLLERTVAFAALSEKLRSMASSEREDFVDVLGEAAERDLRATTLAELMDWDDVRALAVHDLVTLGGHTHSHPQLALFDEQTVLCEISDSCRTIQRETGRKVVHFAYPFGQPKDADAREFDACSTLGLSTAVTTRHGVLTAAHRDCRFALPRLPISGERASLPAAKVTLSGALGVCSRLIGRTR
jgi:peptidoglycan/xylan/chitin deacetylase (PgdA/CDA1 family)